MISTVFFKDGHTEKILWYVKHGDSIEFCTKSGHYCFAYFIDETDLPFQSKTISFQYLYHKFFKYSRELCNWLVTLDIDHIKIYEGESNHEN